MNISRSHIGLINWFWASQNETRTLTNIKNVCTNLIAEQKGNLSLTNPAAKEISDIISPLFKLGVIEYYGESRFGLSPTCSIAHDDSILLCNVPKFILNTYIDQCNYDSQVGLGIYKKNVQLENDLIANQIPISDFNLQLKLKELSPLSQIIKDWKNDIVFDASNFYFLNSKLKWSKNQTVHQLRHRRPWL